MLKKNLGLDISEMLDSEIVPDTLNFTLEPRETVDWAKLNYEDYKTPEFYASRFPSGWQTIPGFEKVFEDMAGNAKSPLDEMIDRKLEADKADSEWQPLDDFENIFGKIIISKEV